MGQVTLAAGTIISLLVLFGQGEVEQPVWQARRIVSLEYPPLAAQARIEGVVEVECLLAKDGSVRTARATRGNEILAKAARENAMKWQFQQTSREASGVAVSSVAVKYTFRLSGTCSKNRCPTIFMFEFPNRAMVEVEAPEWQPDSR